MGNIVRRVLGLIREEAEDDRDQDAGSLSDGGNTNSPDGHSSPKRDTSSSSFGRPSLSSSISNSSPLRHGAIEPMGSSTVADVESGQEDIFQSQDIQDQEFQRSPLISHNSYAVSNTAPMMTSMFSLLSHEGTPSPSATPTGAQSPIERGTMTAKQLARLGVGPERDLKPDIMGGIDEIIDELGQVDDQIAAYALDHIHSNEIILTHTSSRTVQKFLLKAASKRKFTVVHAEAFPNDHEATHATVTGQPVKKSHDGKDEEEMSVTAFQKPLTALGITVILIPDSAVFAMMSRVNKVILGTHAVLANGGLVAAAGARTIAQAARMHRTPVVVVSGVYKLSPVYPFDFEALIEHGDPSRVIPYEDADLVEKVDVENPLFDYVPAELVDLYITNLYVESVVYQSKTKADRFNSEGDMRRHICIGSSRITTGWRISTYKSRAGHCSTSRDQ